MPIEMREEPTGLALGRPAWWGWFLRKSVFLPRKHYFRLMAGTGAIAYSSRHGPRWPPRGTAMDVGEVIRRWRQVPLHDGTAADIAVVLVLALASVPAAVLGSLWPIGSVQFFISTAMLLRRRAPLLVAGLVIVTGLVVLSARLAGAAPSVATVYTPLVGGEQRLYRFIDPWTPIAIGVAVHAVSRYGRRWHAALAGAGLALLTLMAAQPWRPAAWPGIPVQLLITAAPALIGLYAAARERLVSTLADRADRARREQRLRVEQAGAQVRAWLAAEMHDVLAHRVSLIVLQAGAWRVKAPDPGSRETAEAIRVAGCQVLDELRDLLGVLQAASAATLSGNASIPVSVPLPGLDPLLEAARKAGSSVSFRHDGDAVLVSPVVSRVIYRIVQESLTNVRKHAARADVEVCMRSGPGEVSVHIRNSAPAVIQPGDVTLGGTGSGVGLLGLRERVALLHGVLRAGPAEDGGFEVTARLPLVLADAGG